MALQHLRSSAANKRPAPSGMSDGQLAVNTNLASPGLFLKDSNNDLAKIGPVHVGSGAPNATPASGGTAGNSKGESWLDTANANPLLKVWDGSAWRIAQPVASGTVVSTSDTGSVTSTMLLDGTIVNADINASAAIGLSKLATGALPSGITIASANIVDGTIVNADINASAAIADTKLATISTAGKVSGSAITSGAIDTTGELRITNAFPAIRLTESGGTSTHSQTMLVRDGDQFSLQTRDSAGTLVSNDYLITTDASGATGHRWYIAGSERLRVNSAGTLVLAASAGLSISSTGVSTPSAADGNVFSGTYTPTLTNDINVSSSTAFACHYMRVGNVVTVGGRVVFTATAANTDTTLRMSLPIASNFTNSYQAGGAGACASNGEFGESVAIQAETVNDGANFLSRPTVTSSQSYFFSFTYQIA